MTSLPHLERDFQKLANPKQAIILRSFFKTGPGQYGEGDVFLGLKVPQTRSLANKYCDLPLQDTLRLLHSPVHEKRLLALLLLVRRFEKAGTHQERERIFKLYLRHLRFINNWDLVDLSAPQIVGVHFSEMPGPERLRRLLKFAASPHLWTRRVSVLATFPQIRNGQTREIFAVARALLDDPHDLIHKAVGWMLREAAKRDFPAVERFISRHGSRMPRTMLRYALERFPETKRRHYMETTRR